MSTSGSEPARLTVRDGIATVTLDRGDRMNPIDLAMAACLHRLGDELLARDDLRVVVVEGSGPAFCAGGDIATFMANIDDPGPTIRRLLDDYHEFIVALRTTPAVVITKLHGAVAGAGLSLAFMGDLAVASADARFVPGYAKLGVSPDGGGTVGLVARAGSRLALRLFVAEDGFDAAQALGWGLVDHVVPRAELDGKTTELAARLARVAPAALAGTKRLVMRESEAELRALLEAEAETLIACTGTDEFKAAVRRFMAASARKVA